MDHVPERIRNSLRRDEIADSENTFEDVSGKPLNPKMVREARLDAVKGTSEFKKWGVVPIRFAFDRTAKPPMPEMGLILPKTMTKTVNTVLVGSDKNSEARRKGMTYL